MKMSQSTRMRVKILLTAWLAVSAAILSTACSSSGGGNGGAPRQAAPGAKPAQTPPPYNYTAPGVGGLDKNSGKSQQEPPTADSNSGGGDSSAPAPDPSVVHYDPTGLTPTQVFEQPRSGNSSGNPSDVQDGSGAAANYSGASQDDLRGQILALIASNQDPDSAHRDSEFAAELSKGMFSLDGNRLASVTILQSKANGEKFKITLRGTLDGAGRVRFPAVGPGISGAAECLDLNGGCDNVHLKVIDASTDARREAHLIIRTTNSTLYTQGNGFDISHNSEYNTFLNVLVNTATRKSDCGLVNKLVLQTSETLNGVSNVAVAMDMLVGRARQYLRFNGPLVRLPDSDDLNVSMMQTPANFAGGPGLISDTISNISLVRNDGHGNVQVAITIRAVQPDSKEDTVTLTLARIQKPTKAPTSLRFRN